MTDAHTSATNFSGGWRLSAPKLFFAAAAFFFFLLPWQTRYFLREIPLYEWGTISVYAVEALGWMVIILGMIKVKSQKSPHQSRLGAEQAKVKNSWFLSLPVLVFFSIVWAPDKLVALQAAVRLTEGILLFFVIRNFIGNWKLEFRNFLLWAFIAGATLQAGLGIYQFLTQSAFSSALLGIALHDPRELGTAVVEFGDQRWLRAYGGLPHPNVLGGYLAVALVISYQGLPRVAKSYQRVILWGVVPILLTGIFFSFSRTAWLATLPLFALALLRSFLRRGGFLAAARNPPQMLLLAYTIFLLIFYWPLVDARLNLQSTERLEVKSRVERVQGAREVRELIKKYPVFGVGAGNYTQARQNLDTERGNLAGQVVAKKSLYDYQPVHSVPLLILAELGIVGLLLWLGMLWKVRRSLDSALLAPLGITMGGLLLFDHYLWSLPVGVLLFWPILGLTSTHPQDPS